MGFYYPPQTVTLNQLDGVTVGATEPSGPADGDLWIDLATGQIKVWLLGQWRIVGSDTPTDDRYGVAASSIPGLVQELTGDVPLTLEATVVSVLPALEQALAGTVPLSGDIVSELPGLGQAAAGTVAVDLPESLGDLDDVNVDGAVDGAELVFNETSGEWQPSEMT